ncbi:MAG: hypothetical protein V4640_09160 [Verrucomicrobiota bacterium]
MKPKSLQKIAAITVATLGIAIYQQQRMDPSPMPKAKNRPEHAKQDDQEDIALPVDVIIPKTISQKHSASRVSPSFNPTQPTTGQSAHVLHKLQPPEQSESNAQEQHPSSSKTEAVGENSIPPPPSSHPARTIQLANNFQLPAVLLTAASSTTPGMDKPKNPVEQATQAIVDDFYRNLAERLPDAVPADGETILPVQPVEENIVITPDPETDSVRRHADELYRALFGDEAFGRKGMEGTLEVRLPESFDEASQ